MHHKHHDEPSRTSGLPLPATTLPYQRRLIQNHEIAVFCGRLAPATWTEASNEHANIMLLIGPASCRLRLRASGEDEDTWRLSGGQFCIVGPSFPHEAHWEQDATIAVMHVGGNFLRRVGKQSQLKGVHIRELAALAAQDPIATLIISIFRSLCEDHEERDVELILVLGRALASRLIKGVAETAQSDGARDDQLSHKQQKIVIAYMDSNLDRRIPVAELAKLVCLSPSHFMRTFKSTTGASAGQFHLLRRLRQAEETLLTTEASIADVASQFGFFDQNHFTRRFRTYLKYSPGALLRLRKARRRLRHVA